MYRAWFRARGTDARLTPRRILVLVIFSLLFVGLQLISRICWVLDAVFFSQYRRVVVREPVFIVGPPRSATTFMQRLLAQDRDRFTGMALWEIVLAPTVIQKVCLRWLGQADRWLGGHLKRAVLTWEKSFFGRVGHMHKISLWSPEEDDPLFLFAFASAYLNFFFPFPSAVQRFTRFDDDVPAATRTRLMRWYRACIQKHLLVYGPDKQYLAKNPAFSPKIRSLQETFPDACFVGMLRDPAQAVPSAMSLFAAIYPAFGSPIQPVPLQAESLTMLRDWYLRLLAAPRLPDIRIRLITYPEMARYPGLSVRNLYADAGWDMTPDFMRVLEAADTQAATWKSTHQYDLALTGMTAEAFDQFFTPVYTQLQTIGYHDTPIGYT
ncbi:MAG: sulfotransferase [Bacteroidia bacterium]|nr:sulfotransferase [Bacteroidia bacterium]